MVLGTVCKQRARLWNGRHSAESLLHHRNADGCLVVYDYTDDASFNRARYILRALYQHSPFPTPTVALVGTRCDSSRERCISTLEASDLAHCYQSESFQVSLRTGNNVDQAFWHIFDALYIRNQVNMRLWARWEVSNSPREEGDVSDNSPRLEDDDESEGEWESPSHCCNIDCIIS